MCGSSASRSRSARTSRDLPMPGSPESSTTCPSPSRARAQRSSRSASSCSRPTSGVSAAPRSASKRPSACAVPPDAPSPHRLGEPLEPSAPRGRRSSNRPPTSCAGALGDHDRARARPAPAGGRPGSASRRPRPPLARRPRRSGRRPRPRRSRSRPGPRAAPRSRRRAAGRRRGHGREPGPDRALGVVLVRPRPAEIGQHAVAHELGDVAVEARDLAGDARPGRRGSPRACPPGRAGVESAVEPTRSTNMTVSWRRSAWDGPAGTRRGAASLLDPHRCERRAGQSLDRLQQRPCAAPAAAPSSRRSASVSSGRASGVISASRNAGA